MDAGNYIFRTIATDSRGNSRVTDKYIELVTRQSAAPSIIRSYPPLGATNVPGNAPTVVAFDRDMNQPTLDSKALTLHSEIGESYSNSLYDYKSRTLTIVPDKLYSIKKFHYFMVNGHLPSQQGVEIGGDFVSSFSSSIEVPTGDIDSLTPARGETHTPVTGQQLRVYYNRSSSHSYVTVFSLSGDTVYAGEVQGGFNPGSVPLSGLLPKTYYLVRISDSPAFDGDSDYMSYFITEDTEMPVVMDYQPQDSSWLIGLNDPIRVSFNKPMNTFSIDTSSFYVSGPSGRASGVIEFGGDGTTSVTFYSNEPFESGSEYTVTLTDHVQDNIGNPVRPMSWSFFTGTFGTARYDGSVIRSNGIEVTFPLGSVPSDVEIGIGQVPSDQVPVSGGLEFTGIAYDIEPATDLFREAVLNLRIPDSTLSQYGPIDRLKVYYYDTVSSEWQYLGGSGSDGTVSTAIGSLGRYGLFQTAEESAQVEFASSVSLIPRVISPRTGGVDRQLQVAYRLASSTPVVAKIYDTRGQLVTTLMDGDIGSVGQNLLAWDGKRRDGGYANDGLYILAIEADGQTVRKTFVILNR
jgi:hypothetical protein